MNKFVEDKSSTLKFKTKTKNLVNFIFSVLFLTQNVFAATPAARAAPPPAATPAARAAPPPAAPPAARTAPPPAAPPAARTAPPPEATPAARTATPAARTAPPPAATPAARTATPAARTAPQPTSLVTPIKPALDRMGRPTSGNSFKNAAIFLRKSSARKPEEVTASTSWGNVRTSSSHRYIEVSSLPRLKLTKDAELRQRYISDYYQRNRKPTPPPVIQVRYNETLSCSSGYKCRAVFHPYLGYYVQRTYYIPTELPTEVVQEFYPDRSGTHLLQLMIAHQVYLDQIAAYNEIVRKAVTSNAVIPPAPTPPPKTSGDPVFIPIPDNGATALQDGKKCSLDPQGTLIAAPSIMGSQIQIDDTEVSVFYISNPTTTSASGTKSNCRAQDHVRINPKDLYLFQQQVANNLESGTEQMKRKMQEVLINQPTEVDTTDTDVDKLTVCSGETNGTYSKWAFRLKDELKQDFDLDVSVKHTNGSWQNIQYMQNGMCDFAIAQSDATSLFFSNLVEGEKPLFNIKSLDYFKEAAFLICSKKSNLSHIQELFDTDRITISTGVDGSGSKITWDAIVSLIPNLKRLTTVSFNYSTALEKMKSTSDRDSVDCLFQVINKNSATFKDNIKMYLNQLSFIDFKNVNIDHDNSFNPFKIDSLYGYFESWFTDFPNIDTPVLSSQILMSTELEQTEDDETIDLRNTILKTIEDIKSEFN